MSVLQKTKYNLIVFVLIVLKKIGQGWGDLCICLNFVENKCFK